MLPSLSLFLDDFGSAEDKYYIAEADRVLVLAGDDNYEHVLEEIIVTAEDQDAGVPLANIYAVYRNQLNSIMAVHAIHVTSDISLLMLAELVEGIFQLENHDNPKKLLDVAEEDASRIEKLAAVLSQVTRHSIDEIALVIDDISEGFIERLKQVNQHGDDQDAEEDLNEVRERMAAYRKYERFIEASGTIATVLPELLRQGIPAGLPYSLYVRQIDLQLPLAGQSAKRIATELFGAAIISIDGYTNPGETVKASLEQYINDIRVIGDTMVEVRRLMIGYEV